GVQEEWGGEPARREHGEFDHPADELQHDESGNEREDDGQNLHQRLFSSSFIPPHTSRPTGASVKSRLKTPFSIFQARTISRMAMTILATSFTAPPPRWRRR